MPSRNVIKVNLVDSYYHVYARGISKQPIFIDDDDSRYFLSLFERYLSPRGDSNAEYVKLFDSVEVLAYCLMSNHFHLLIYQINEDGMSRLMHSVMTSYSRYFNAKYKKTGPLFESRYKASLVDCESYLLHISRYIHLNPENWLDCPHSSIRAYLYDDSPSWLSKSRISDMYGSAIKYLEFLKEGIEKDEDPVVAIEY